jgi:FMN-dependent NADH-azoreductase
LAQEGTGFPGHTDISLLYVEGMARGEAVAEKAFADASKEILKVI